MKLMFEKQSIFKYGVVLFYFYILCSLKQYDDFCKHKDFHEAFISNINMYCYQSSLVKKIQHCLINMLPITYIILIPPLHLNFRKRESYNNLNIISKAQVSQYIQLSFLLNQRLQSLFPGPTFELLLEYRTGSTTIYSELNAYTFLVSTE